MTKLIIVRPLFRVSKDLLRLIDQFEHPLYPKRIYNKAVYTNELLCKTIDLTSASACRSGFLSGCHFNACFLYLRGR